MAPARKYFHGVDAVVKLSWNVAEFLQTFGYSESCAMCSSVCDILPRRMMGIIGTPKIMNIDCKKISVL